MGGTAGSDRRQRQRDQHHREILAAAEMVFAEKGFHDSTMEDIAKRSEFSVGTLYNFFSGKSDLYTTLLLERIEQIHGEITKSISSEKNPVKIIESYIKTRMLVSQTYVSFAKVFMREWFGTHHSQRQTWEKIITPLRDRTITELEKVIRQGANDGVFSSGLNARDVVVLLDGMIECFFHEWFKNANEYPLLEKQETIRQIFFSGVLKR